MSGLIDYVIKIFRFEWLYVIKIFRHSVFQINFGNRIFYKSGSTYLITCFYKVNCSFIQDGCSISQTISWQGVKVKWQKTPPMPMGWRSNTGWGLHWNFFSPPYWEFLKCIMESAKQKLWANIKRKSYVF